MSEDLLDCLGRRRSPASTSAFHSGRPPGNRGVHYPADELLPLHHYIRLDSRTPIGCEP